jgi:hypothetical protein
MKKITYLNFQNQTIEKIEVYCENVDNVEIKLTKKKFNIVIVKDGKIIYKKKEIKKKNVPEVVVLVIEDIEEEPVVDLVIEDIEEVVKLVVEPVVELVVEPVVEPVKEVVEPVEEVFEPVVENVVEPVVDSVVMVVDSVVENVVEPVVEDELIVESEQEPIIITLGKMNQLLKKNIPPNFFLNSYFRTIQQGYNWFNILDVNELLLTKEQDIIDFIENQFTNDSTIKCKLCSVYKSYKILNVIGELKRIKLIFTPRNKPSSKTKIKNQTKRRLKKSIISSNTSTIN